MLVQADVVQLHSVISVGNESVFRNCCLGRVGHQDTEVDEEVSSLDLSMSRKLQKQSLANSHNYVHPRQLHLVRMCKLCFSAFAPVQSGVSL